MGIIRHILTFGGGYLVAKGIIDEATMLNAVGAVVTILGVVWSVVNKKAA
jgi:hypothetical protein